MAAMGAALVASPRSHAALAQNYAALPTIACPISGTPTAGADAAPATALATLVTREACRFRGCRRAYIASAAMAAVAVVLLASPLVGLVSPGPEAAPRRPLPASPAADMSDIEELAELAPKTEDSGDEAPPIDVDTLPTMACSATRNIYLPGNDLVNITGVENVGDCCEKCRAHKECLAWTWGGSSARPDANVCFLKGAKPHQVTKVKVSGYVSGLTLQMNKPGAPLGVRTPAPGQSLFCFSLVQPDGYEHDLIAVQYDLGVSIFNCDEYALYSNRQVSVAPGIWTNVINSTLKCSMGGEFGTALNTGVFLALWAKIVMDGRFLYHDWTVKVDPDAVFAPERLRMHLMGHLEADSGVYLNNCKFGLHGPLEVFSRNAVKVWALGARECVDYFTQLCKGACGWGEDMFIDQCMKRKLKIRRDHDFTLLLEDHCDPPKGWQDCTDKTVVAFHPFKEEKTWRDCMKAVQSGGVLFKK